MRRRSTRVTLVITGVVLLVVILSLRSIATFWTDYLWFKEVGQSSVFVKTLTAKIGLALIFGIAFFVLTWLNLFIADRLAPVYVPMSPEEEIVGRYRDTIAPYRRWIRIGVAGVLAFFVGTAAVAHWSDWLLFLNHVDFGVKDPQFGRDVGFLVFQLPFYEFVVNWFLATLIFVTLITAAVHYLNGGIRFQTQRSERVTPAVKAHLSVLFGVLALFKGAGYYLNRYELLYSARGFTFSRGASATDVNAQLPALNLLVGIMVVVAILFLINIRLRGWIFPAAALSIWVLVSMAAGGLFPLLYQRIKVQPSEARVVRKNPVIDDRESFRRALFTRRLWKATPSISVKRDTALQVPFDETLRRLQDFDFLIRASEVANCASTDLVLWVKYWDSNAISAQDNMISANVELVRRHPEYLKVPEYRPGLAYILRLALWRRLKKANFAGAVRDVKQLAEAFGPGQAARLLFEAGFPRRFV